MKIYVLTTTDGGDNEIFCGAVSDTAKIKNPSFYFIYEVELDSGFTDEYEYMPPMQKFTEIHL